MEINHKQTQQLVLRSKAFFLMTLILLLPFYISDVYAIDSSEFAGLIKSIQVYDALEIHQVLQPESTTINVVTRIKDVNITPETVFVNDLPFQVCDSAAGYTTCSTSIPVSLSQGMMNIQVAYESVTQNVPVVIDKTAPKVTSFTIQQVVVNPGTTTPASLTITDSALNTGFCAGIKKLEIAKDSSFTDIVYEKNYPFEGIQSCIKQEVAFLNISAETPGNIKLYARAIDHANNVQTAAFATAEVVYDDVPPAVKTVKFFFNGKEVTTVPSGEQEITIQARIYEDSELAEVSLDLPSLTVGSEKGTCSDPIDKVYLCSWTGTLAAFRDDTLSGTIHTIDNADNEGSYPVSFGVTVDTQGPVISNIGTVSQDLLGPDKTQNNVVATITDEDSEVDFSTVFADLKMLNYGARTEPTRCENNVCVWANLTIARSDGPVTIAVTAKDMLGFSTTTSATLYIDTQGPIITAVEQNTPTPSIENPLTFYLKYKEINGIVKAEADVSSISSQKVIQGNCGAHLAIPADTFGQNENNTTEEKSDNTKSNTSISPSDKFDVTTQPGEAICIFDIADLKNDALTATVTFTLTDTIGNIGTYQREVRIFQIEKEGQPHVVAVEIDQPKPPKIDRNIASKIPLKVFVPMHLKTSDDTLIKEKQVVCEGGTEYLSTGSGDNPYLLGEDLDDPFLVFTIALDDSAKLLNEITFDCELSMIVRSQGVVYKQPETETFTVTLPLYNVPIGELDQTTIDKLKNIKDITESGWFTFAETLDQIFTVVKKICNIMNIINKVYGVIESVKPLVLAVATFTKIDALWKGFLWIECGVKSVKDFLWPNDSKYAYDFKTGGFWSLIGGKAPASEATAGGFGSVGGIARRACAFTTCSQCNRGFGLTGLVQENQLFGNLLTKTTGITLGEDVRLGESPEEAYERRINESKTINMNVLKDVNLDIHMDPFNSWAVAVGCLCVPGIISNALKYRDLQCIHAKCITDNARYGFSTAPCDIEHSVRTCTFWWGALFQLVPGYLLFKTIIGKVLAFVRELPARLVLSLKDYLCRPVETAKKNLVPTGETFAQCQKRSIPNTAGSPIAVRSVVCGATDLAMLIYSWDQYIGNALDFQGLFDFSYERGQICKDAFAALDGEKDNKGINVSNSAVAQQIQQQQQQTAQQKNQKKNQREQRITIA